MTRFGGAAGIGLAVVLISTALAAPSFYQPGNLADLVLANSPVLLSAIGMTLVILLGEIDISVGAQFAVAAVLAGWMAKAGLPMLLVAAGASFAGAAMGAVNGALVAGLRIPSIVVTLATMMAIRDGLRWRTEGAWVQDLPHNFQWAGLGQTGGSCLIVLTAAVLLVAFLWGLRHLQAGRALYATGCAPEAARLAGLHPRRIVFAAFLASGALTGLAALLSSMRFSDIPSNTGAGLEMKVIAAVVVGGVSISGGRGSLAGVLLGVALLGLIGTALTFLGISAFWEKAAQGAIILLAVITDAVARREGHAAAPLR